jgi:1-deoxy-D-xylulose-5-phosphate synthase
LSGLLSFIDSPSALRRLEESKLPELCQEIRSEIVSICGKVGGHLGASLGAVELIVALHRVFKSPVDSLVFDVGHQAYAHKILTGRLGRMATLRQEGGIAPFLDARESPHDAFGAGHACTAVSAALGLLQAKAMGQKAGKVVAVIGDGSLTGGMTFEGLNNAGASSLPLVVVCNDNQMSISRNVGAVASLLSSPSARAFFESLGFTYLGPADGHDIRALLALLTEARRSHRPVLVHVRTQKGRGFADAEADEKTRGHAMGPYEWRDGKWVRSRFGQKTFSDAFAEALEAEMERDERVVAVSPAMLEGSSLTGVLKRFPDRVFDVGIAEQHAVTFSAGLAKEGQRPVCCLYSTFLQRAWDSIIHDVCLPGLPVVFAVDRAGLVGADGATHQGAYDIAALRPLPGLWLSAPVWGRDLAPLLQFALAREGPSAIRFPRGTLPALPPGVEAPQGLTSPSARWLKKSKAAQLCAVATGPLALSALEALASDERVSVLDARFISPLDREALKEAARAGKVLTVEEGTVRGGLGSAVLELFAQEGWKAQVRCLGLPDAFVPHGEARAQRAALGLDAQGIRKAADALLEGVAPLV